MTGPVPPPGWPPTAPQQPGPNAPGPQYGGPIPPIPPSRKVNGVVAVAVMALVMMVVVAGASFLAGRLTAPKSDASPGAANTARGNAPIDEIPTATPAALGSPGFTVSDPAGDAVEHAVDGKVYGPGDIVSVAVRTDGTYLLVTTVYTPETPMNLLSGATRIRMNPDAVPTCKDSVLDSFDWSIDYDDGAVSVFRPGPTCDDNFQRTSIAGTSDITGSTLTIRIAADRLGISPGQHILVRACISTRIDNQSTTFIQDWAPDSPSGAAGNA